jgi:hypothetical protein
MRLEMVCDPASETAREPDNQASTMFAPETMEAIGEIRDSRFNYTGLNSIELLNCKKRGFRRAFCFQRLASALTAPA